MFLRANHWLWLTRGSIFKACLNLKRALRALKGRPWNGFGIFFLEKSVFDRCIYIENKITISASPEALKTGLRTLQGLHNLFKSNIKRYWIRASIFGSCKVPLQGALEGPRYDADPPPLPPQGYGAVGDAAGFSRLTPFRSPSVLRHRLSNSFRRSSKVVHGFTR